MSHRGVRFFSLFEELSGVTPDLMTLAKPLAGGLPIGAVLLTEVEGGGKGS